MGTVPESEASEDSKRDDAMLLARLSLLSFVFSLVMCLSQCRHAVDWVFHALSMAALFWDDDPFQSKSIAQACYLLGIYFGIRAFFAVAPRPQLVRIAGAGSLCAIALSVLDWWLVPDLMQ